MASSFPFAVAEAAANSFTIAFLPPPLRVRECLIAATGRGTKVVAGLSLEGLPRKAQQRLELHVFGHLWRILSKRLRITSCRWPLRRTSRTGIRRPTRSRTSGHESIPPCYSRGPSCRGGRGDTPDAPRMPDVGPRSGGERRDGRLEHFFVVPLAAPIEPADYRPERLLGHHMLGLLGPPVLPLRFLFPPHLFFKRLAVAITAAQARPVL